MRSRNRRFYNRFIVLGEARTGSTMLVQALNSRPDTICFREVFNSTVGHIDYSVDGYEDFSAEDWALRSRDPVMFLNQRLFHDHPPDIRAVGFKFFYSHATAYRGVVRQLVADPGLRVVHIRRRSLLRSFVSLKIAEATGIWAEGDTRLTQDGSLAARTTNRPSVDVSRRRVRASQQECRRYFSWVERAAGRFEALFDGHPILTVWYEDLLHRQDQTLDTVQMFLGLQPHPLVTTLRRQNPEGLRDLLENYDELCRAFEDTPYAKYFNLE